MVIGIWGVVVMHAKENENAENRENVEQEVSSNVLTSDNNVAVYKLFPTQNMWTFIKLNTRTGQMWQVQYDVNGDNRGEYDLNEVSLAAKEKEVNGRFTLYPTQNIYNFILLDQINGQMWQIQWSIDDEKRGIVSMIR